MLLSVIYAITDPQILPGERLFSGVEAALEGGIRTIQYRDKHATEPQLLDNASALLALCKRYDAQLIINDHAAIAAQVGAHGVHIGQEDGSVINAREALGRKAIVGVTCHDSLTLAGSAAAEGASYLAFGRFFPSSTKPSAKSAHVNILQQAKAQYRLPVVAIGGITLQNMHHIISHGADSIALCAGVFGARDIRKTAKELINCWNQNHV